jgi:hypothetical protein
LYRFASEYGAQVQTPFVSISKDARGELWLPSPTVFKRLQPTSPPAGMIFPNDAFLVLKERVRFGDQNEEVKEATIYREEYSYHFQHPARCLFFRFDYHPSKGDPKTHPPHHLVCGPCLPQARKLPEVPRFNVGEVTLADVLAMLIMNEELLG